MLLKKGGGAGRLFYKTCFYYYFFVYCAGHWELVHESHQLMDSTFATFLKGE